MGIFVTLLIKLIPLYIMIFLGYIGGRFLHIKSDTIARLLIDIIVPVVLFTGVLTTKLTLSTLSLPILFFAVCTIISVLMLLIGGFIWQDATRNIFAFTAGSANTGYFGLPVAVALFGNSAIGVAALALFGTAFYINVLGFYIAARGHHTAEESIIKVLKLPLFYALLLGILANLLSIHLGKIFFDTANDFNGAYIILGMMLIGMGLADIKEYSFDFTFVGLSLLAKFLLWPLLVIAIFFIDSLTFKLYNHNLYKMVVLLSIVPLAVTTVPYATVLKAYPEKVSLAVLTSTVFALFYIPLIAVLFLK